MSEPKGPPEGPAEAYAWASAVAANPVAECRRLRDLLAQRGEVMAVMQAKINELAGVFYRACPDHEHFHADCVSCIDRQRLRQTPLTPHLADNAYRLVDKHMAAGAAKSELLTALRAVVLGVSGGTGRSYQDGWDAARRHFKLYGCQHGD